MVCINPPQSSVTLHVAPSVAAVALHPFPVSNPISNVSQPSSTLTSLVHRATCCPIHCHFSQMAKDNAHTTRLFAFHLDPTAADRSAIQQLATVTAGQHHPIGPDERVTEPLLKAMEGMLSWQGIVVPCSKACARHLHAGLVCAYMRVVLETPLSEGTEARTLCRRMIGHCICGCSVCGLNGHCVWPLCSSALGFFGCCTTDHVRGRGA